MGYSEIYPPKGQRSLNSLEGFTVVLIWKISAYVRQQFFFFKIETLYPLSGFS